MPDPQQIADAIEAIREHRDNVGCFIAEYALDQKLGPGQVAAVLRTLAAECDFIAATPFPARG